METKFGINYSTLWILKQLLFGSLKHICLHASFISQQKPNCCFRKQLSYCSCMAILPVL